MSAPFLWCPTRRWCIEDPPRTVLERQLVVAGATGIIHDSNGAFKGIYIDDQTPDRDQVASLHVQVHALGGITIVGIRADEPDHRISGCITALEWYPFPSYTDAVLPGNQQAYITQRTYRYNPDPQPEDPHYMDFDPTQPAPTRVQWLGLYLRALAKRPSSGLVITY